MKRWAILQDSRPTRRRQAHFTSCQFFSKFQKFCPNTKSICWRILGGFQPTRRRRARSNSHRSPDRIDENCKAGIKLPQNTFHYKTRWVVDVVTLHEKKQRNALQRNYNYICSAAMFSGLLVDFLRGFSCVPSSGFGVSSTLDLKRTFWNCMKKPGISYLKHWNI